MRKSESPDEILAGIELTAFKRKQTLLIASAKIVIVKTGIKFDHWVGDYDDRDKLWRLRQNQHLDHIRQGHSIAVCSHDAEALSLGATAVAVGYAKQWNGCSWATAQFKRPDRTIYFIMPLIYGESDDCPYTLSDDNISITDVASPAFQNDSSFEDFAHGLQAIADSFGNIELPYFYRQHT